MERSRWRPALAACLFAAAAGGCRKDDSTESVRASATGGSGTGETRLAAISAKPSQSPERKSEPSATPSTTETAAAPALVRADGKTLDEVEREIISKTKAVKTCRADVERKSEVVIGGQRRVTLGTGRYDYERRGDKVLYRIEEDVTIVLTTGMEGETATHARQTAVVVCDGDYLYTSREHSQRPSRASKNRAETEVLGFDLLRETHDLRLLPDETINGHDVYVIEAVLKSEIESPPMRSVNYYLKDRGMLLGYVVYGADGVEFDRRMYSNFQFDVEIPAERFVFHAPEGVEIQDLSQEPPAPTASNEGGAAPAPGGTEKP